MRPPAALSACFYDAAAFCLGYVLTSTLLTGGPSTIFVVDPRIFPDGTVNARVVVVASITAGILLVVARRTGDRWRRRRARH